MTEENTSEQSPTTSEQPAVSNESPTTSEQPAVSNEAPTTSEETKSSTGYDPKNREVTAKLIDGQIIVTKEATGYSETFSDFDKAKEAFDFQVGCSQN